MRKLNWRKVLRAAVSRVSLRRRHYCVICGHAPGKFLPYRQGSSSTPALMRALETVGSDTDNFECPWCGCHDRERHLLLYTKATGILDSLAGKRVLHFAPERKFSRFIEEARPARYIKADLYPAGPDIQRVDMLDMPFTDAEFDLVIANHVLEHVADDARALAEIFRVMAPGGHAILQTPYSARLSHSWSDPGIDTDAARLQAYGQEDHVRLYGKDIFDRFAASGLIPQVGTHAELLPDVDPGVFGVNAREPFFLFEKAEAR